MPSGPPRSKTTAAVNSGLPRLGRLLIPYLAATSIASFCSSSGGTRAASRSSWLSIWITASLRNVAGPARNSTGSSPASSAHGPGIGLAPGGTLRGEAALEPQEAAQVRGQEELAQVSLGEDYDRVFAEHLAQLLRGPVAGRVGVDQGVGAGVGRDPRRRQRRGEREQRRDRQDRPGVPGGPGGGGPQSIESGPVTSALRNCATNAFSESKSSSFGPDSTIFPFHRTARKSAIRRAVLRSWLIVR